jgi:hypothetical protein
MSSLGNSWDSTVSEPSPGMSLGSHYVQWCSCTCSVNMFVLLLDCTIVVQHAVSGMITGGKFLEDFWHNTAILCKEGVSLGGRVLWWQNVPRWRSLRMSDHCMNGGLVEYTVFCNDFPAFLAAWGLPRYYGVSGEYMCTCTAIASSCGSFK